MSNDNPLPLDSMTIADHESGSVAFERNMVEQARQISLDNTLAAIRLQILTDEAQRAAQSPMRKLLELAQSLLIPGYYR